MAVVPIAAIPGGESHSGNIPAVATIDAADLVLLLRKMKQLAPDKQKRPARRMKVAGVGT
jgi:hypothetical protein